MISTKQRAKLRTIAQHITPAVIVGKEGLTETVVQTISDVLSKREIVKIKVLNTASIENKELLNLICEKLSAEPVQQIGNMLVVYKRSDREDIVHIEI